MDLSEDISQLCAWIMNLNMIEIVEELNVLYGTTRITAYLSGFDSQLSLQEWAEREVLSPSDDIRGERLRCALLAGRIISLPYDDMTARAWLWGTNSQLDQDEPAYVIRHAEVPSDLIQVIPAAVALSVA